MLASLLLLRAKGQPFAGYQSGNYTGVNGVFFNPANIADNRYQWDINIAAVNGFTGFSSPGLHFGDIVHGLTADTLKEALLRGNAKMSTIAYGDVLGPSFMIGLGPRTAFAFTTRTRVFSNTKDINGDLFNSVFEASGPHIASPIGVIADYPSFVHTTGWTEFGLSIARVFTKQGNPNFFKGGITLKYLAGTADASLTMNNLNAVLADQGGAAYFVGPSSGSMTFQATAGANFSKYQLNDIFKFSGNGFGGDIGFVYEWRPKVDYSIYENDRFANKYKLKIGLALLDFGRISFSRSSNVSGNYSMNIPAGQQYDLRKMQGSSISEFRNVMDASPEFFTPGQPPANSYSINLPATVQAGADWLLKKGFGLNVGARVNINPAREDGLYEFNTYWLTPRWENSHYGVELPVSYHDMTGFNAGIGFRVGPLFFGSGSVLSSLFMKSKQVDFYAGLHIGILYKKKIIPDTDDDGVFDNKDKCPNVAGSPRYEGCPVPDTDGDGIDDEADSCVMLPGFQRYHGCPIPDSDGDGINDEEDSCKNVPGLVQYHGCPAPDRDGDGVPDSEDRCPLVAGPAKFQGCPTADRDGDGVTDDRDLCPDEPGPVITQGCPVQSSITDQITADFKNIQFDFGRATIRPGAETIIAHAAETMNREIPNASFYIDGYTDNVGSDAKNKAISKARALAVADALVRAGVDRSRIIVRGFGKDHPKCDNSTDAGRACNRRVEVLIRKG